jgi:hypothetical protein
MTLSRTPDQIRRTLLALGASRQTAEGFARSMNTDVSGPVDRSAVQIALGREIGRFEACGILGITGVEFARLSDNPTFPQPIRETKFRILWSSHEIVAFKVKLNLARARGWRVPDCLYKWEVDLPVRRPRSTLRMNSHL